MASETNVNLKITVPLILLRRKIIQCISHWRFFFAPPAEAGKLWATRTRWVQTQTRFEVQSHGWSSLRGDVTLESNVSKRRAQSALCVPAPRPLASPSSHLTALLAIYQAVTGYFWAGGFSALAGSQGFSGQTGFNDFPNTPGTPTLGEYAPSAQPQPQPQPPPLAYPSEQVWLSPHSLRNITSSLGARLWTIAIFYAQLTRDVFFNGRVSINESVRVCVRVREGFMNTTVVASTTYRTKSSVHLLHNSIGTTLCLNVLSKNSCT